MSSENTPQPAYPDQQQVIPTQEGGQPKTDQEIAVQIQRIGENILDRSQNLSPVGPNVSIDSDLHVGTGKVTHVSGQTERYGRPAITLQRSEADWITLSKHDGNGNSIKVVAHTGDLGYRGLEGSALLQPAEEANTRHIETPLDSKQVTRAAAGMLSTLRSEVSKEVAAQGNSVDKDLDKLLKK